MKIDILTIFPEMFDGPFSHSIVKRAVAKGKVNINLHNLRKWTIDKHKTIDDRPFGGGAGMVMMIEPIDLALKDLKKKGSKVILLSPRGKVFNQKKAIQFSRVKHLIFICGHYEGVDERVSGLVDEEISIGDFVLTGGEIPAMAIVDATVRLLPGVLEKSEATKNESFTDNLLEYPHYTRPADYKGEKVPPILLSGNHKKVDDWRLKKALEKTKKQRPDLL